MTVSGTLGRLPDRLWHLFWNADPGQLDTARDATLIAHRTMTSGDPGAIAWAVENLPGAAAWPKVAAVLPDGAYLAGGTALAVHLHHRVSRDPAGSVDQGFDTRAVRAALERAGDLTATRRSDHTLDGLFDGTRIQFLKAATHQHLDALTVVAGMPVAGIRDLFADKLKVVRDRGELRGYFDLMAIEQAGVHRCEQGFTYYLGRYGLDPDDASLTEIVRAFGYLDDVVADPGLRVSRDVVEGYWRGRQPEIARNLASMS